MKLIDLSMPRYNGMESQYGHMGWKNHPLWPEAFKMEETRSYDADGSSMHVFTMPSPTNTRFITASFRKEFKDEATLDTVDLNKLILRDTVIIDVPKGAEGLIEPEELEAAFNKAPVQKGDALLLRTGWGDDERYFKIGHDFREKSPKYTRPAGVKLMELLEKNESDLWLYDNCDMGGFTIRSGMMAVGGVVNCGAITKPRVKLIIQPLKIKGAHLGPCSAVALEE